MTTTIQKSLEQKLKNLEAGDYIDYNQLYTEIENESDIGFEVKNIYQDSVGFLELWRLGEYGEIVVDAMSGDPMVRKARGIEEVFE